MTFNRNVRYVNFLPIHNDTTTTKTSATTTTTKLGDQNKNDVNYVINCVTLH
jgi:hypothetical protein